MDDDALREWEAEFMRRHPEWGCAVELHPFEVMLARQLGMSRQEFAKQVALHHPERRRMP